MSVLTRARVSVETGHFYADAFARGTDSLAEQFSSVKHYADVITVPGQTSSAFLFDDYHNRPTKDIKPPQILQQIRDASAKAGLRIDYVAREAACIRLSGHVLDLLKSTGKVRETPTQGWLLHDATEERDGLAMSGRFAISSSRPPVSVDVEIYDRPKGEGAPESWSCPYLAAIWQGLRLGRLRDPAFDEPFQLDGDIPSWETWEETPPLIQLESDAAPFIAERTFSILPVGFLPVEHAVDQILGQVGVTLDTSPQITDHIERLFINV